MFRSKHILIILLVVSLFGGIFTMTRAQSAFNRQINYQGKLTNASGVPVADGTYNIAFRLYTTATSATTTNIWEELDTSTNRVQVTGGLFSILLGSTTPLTNVNFNQTLYLGVEIGSTTTPPTWDGEMTPRKKLGAVPAAFEAEKFGGFATTSFLRSDAANSTTTASNWLTFTNNGAGNIAVFTGSGNIGIGTTSPYAKLSVAGSIVGDDYDATTTVGYKQYGTVLLTASPTTFNTFLGLGAGTTTTSEGIRNTFLGYWAGQANTSGDNNAALGHFALSNNTTGISNTAIGTSALLNNTTANFNTAIGVNALTNNTTGANNTAIGLNALVSNTTGTGNTANGYLSLSAASFTGSFNTAIGLQAGFNVTSGYDNIFLGHDANTGGTAITTGFNNIGMGYNIKFPAVSSSNMLNIGNFLFANLPATTTNTSLTTQPLTGKLGVGTSSPYAKLTVWGEGTGTGTAFEIANNASTTLLSVLDDGTTNIGANAASTTISNLLTGSINFEDGAGIISAMNMPVTSAANGTVESFSFGFNSGSSTPLTIYGVANGGGGTTGNAVGIASSSPWRTLSVNGTVAMDGLTASSTGNALCIMTSKEVSDAGGGTCTPSSIRFKENVETLASGFALDELKKLTVVSFDYKDGAFSPEDLKGSYGLIAEDVEKIDPKLVDYGYDGKPLTLKFEKFIGLLVQAVQELVARITGLEDKFNAQQMEIDALKTRMNALDGGTQVGGQTDSAVVATPSAPIDPVPVVEPEPVVVSATPPDTTTTPQQ